MCDDRAQAGELETGRCLVEWLAGRCSGTASIAAARRAQSAYARMNRHCSAFTLVLKQTAACSHLRSTRCTALPDFKVCQQLVTGFPSQNWKIGPLYILLAGSFFPSLSLFPAKGRDKRIAASNCISKLNLGTSGDPLSHS